MYRLENSGRLVQRHSVVNTLFIKIASEPATSFPPLALVSFQIPPISRTTLSGQHSYIYMTRFSLSVCLSVLCLSLTHTHTFAYLVCSTHCLLSVSCHCGMLRPHFGVGYSTNVYHYSYTCRNCVHVYQIALSLCV